MVNYGFVDVVLEFIACAAVLSVSAILARYWHPLLEKVGEACKAGITHPDRDRLLHLVGLTPTAWGLALGIYIRNMYLLGSIMAESPGEYLGQRIYYTLLDLYLFFVSLLGAIGLIITIYFVYKHRGDLEDLLMIIRCNSRAPYQCPDLEIQQLSQRVVAVPDTEDIVYRGATTSSDNNLPHRRSLDTAIYGSDAYQNDGEASQPQTQRPIPFRNPVRRDLLHMEQARDARVRPYGSAPINSSGDELVDTPPPQAQAEDNSRRSSPDTVGEPPSMVSDHGSDDLEPFPETTPYSLRPTSDNMDGVDECSLSRCPTCTDSHASTVPHTRRASAREPLTPTSSTRDYGHSAMWSTLSAIPSGEVQTDGVRQPLLAGIDNWPARNDDSNMASTVSELGNDSQAELERHDGAIIGAFEPSTTTPNATSATNEPEISDNKSCRSDGDVGGRNPMGDDGETSITKVDKELGQETQKEYERFAEFNESRELRLRNQQMLRAYGQDQTIPAALTVHRGVPILPGPSRALVRPRPGLDIPQETLAAPLLRNRNPDPTPQNHPLFEDNTNPSSCASHSHGRLARVMADPRMVQLGGMDGTPTVTRVSSPHLRLQVPESPSLAHGHAAARATESSRPRQRDRIGLEEWALGHRYPNAKPFF